MAENKEYEQIKNLTVDYVAEMQVIKKQDLLLFVMRKMGLRYEDMGDNSPGSVQFNLRANAGQLLSQLEKENKLQSINGEYSLKKQPKIEHKNKPLLDNPAHKDEHKVTEEAKTSNANVGKHTVVENNKANPLQNKSSTAKKVVETKKTIKKEVKLTFNTINNDIEKLYDKVKEADGKYFEKLEEGLMLCLSGCGSAFFERFCGELVGKLYNANKIELQGGVNDGGIDVVVHIKDELGFVEEICIQCKCREKLTKTTAVNEIRQFVGSMLSRQKNDSNAVIKAVFITNAKYHSEAVKYAEKCGINLKLIDGKELAGIMLNYNLGVKEGKGLPILDRDYFKFS